MSSSKVNDRVSVKQASAEAQRRSTRERRQELSNRIRKTKRSQLVTLKRRFVSSSPTPGAASSSSSTTNALEDTALAFLRSNNQDLQSLKALHSALMINNKKSSPPLFANNEVAARQLAEALASILQNSPNAELKVVASRILTNLAATEPFNDGVSYYGRQQPQGDWCQIIVSTSALVALREGVSSSKTSPDNWDVSQQCCWAIGNLAGDSQSCRDAAIQAQVIPALVSCLRRGATLPPASSNGIATCRNAAWALSNLARGATTSAWLFLGGDPNNDNLLLDPDMIASLMLSPEKQQSQEWLEVSHEVCWLLAFLTAREEEAVEFLLSSSAQDLSSQQQAAPSSLVCQAVACRLDQAVQILKAATSFEHQDSMQALRITLPCIRTVGNVASACHGRTIKPLLEAHHRSIVMSLASLMERGSFPSGNSSGDLHSVAVEATWAAGTLLCDAGTADHPSSTIAIPILLPALCKIVGSRYSKLELKREALTALWNAIAAPPASSTEGFAMATRCTRDDYLQTIYTNTPSIMAVLVDLIEMKTMDADVLLPALQLTNALLRRLDDCVPQVRQDFLEANGSNALEELCDRASHYHNYGNKEIWQEQGSDGISDAAEIAADLIDDLFDSQRLEQEEDVGIAPMTSSTNGNFSFGLSEQQQGHQAMQFDFAQVSSTAPPPPQVSAGRGRGRGQPMVPSWMAAQQQQQQNHR